MQFLGSVEASVVGLSHLFHTAADRNGTQLKQLAAFLGKCCENVYGMSEIVLRRNLNVPADVNAVSILVPNPDQFYEGGEANCLISYLYTAFFCSLFFVVSLIIYSCDVL